MIDTIVASEERRERVCHHTRSALGQLSVNPWKVYHFGYNIGHHLAPRHILHFAKEIKRAQKSRLAAASVKIWSRSA